MNRFVPEALATLGRSYVRYAPGTLGKGWVVEKHLNSWLRDNPRRRVVRTTFGARFAVDTRDLIQRYIYLFGVWEPHLTHWIQRRIRPGDTFIDVGANIGYDTILAAGLVGPAGRVVSIEASPTFHRWVEKHIQLNGLGNVRTVNAAVSDKNQLLTFILASSHNMGANSIVPYDGPAESTFKIGALPLPELLTDAEVAKARIIKIDVEGAEGAVVRGLAPVLRLLPPSAEIAIEVTPERMAMLGDSIDDLMETMGSYGFHAYRITNDYTVASYPSAVRQPMSTVTRWNKAIREGTDLIFSRVDAETLQ
ncbi:FkbM family methyltransferase [Streptacidiphilus albus]|uniref:FkbM family methyltransferase n=1 Tax=Streptacidiphilus albus TaxID=105425 RepID=UPI0005AB1E2D|nr:FkbM family methyltransferase [Streptacidiphilus albus]